MIMVFCSGIQHHPLHSSSGASANNVVLLARQACMCCGSNQLTKPLFAQASGAGDLMRTRFRCVRTTMSRCRDRCRWKYERRTSRDWVRMHLHASRGLSQMVRTLKASSALCKLHASSSLPKKMNSRHRVPIPLHVSLVHPPR